MMFDNFIEDNPYHSSDAVFFHPTKNRIFIGDIQAALDLDFLQANHITTVVTAAKDMDHVRYGTQMVHIVYPLLDGKNQNIAAFFDAFYNLIETNICKGSILVHCAAGISRSSTLVISYMMRFNKMSFKEAVAEVRKFRPSVLPNLGFQRQLKKYEEQLRANSKTVRNQRRGQSRTNESGQSQTLMKTQLMPNFRVLAGTNFKQKLMSGLIRDKNSEKDARVFRIYNMQSREESKHKKFVITKKAASFSRQQEQKGLIITNFREQAKKSSRELNRLAKTPLQQLKAAYLPRKVVLERHVPTERGGTFYNPINTKMQF